MVAVRDWNRSYFMFLLLQFRESWFNIKLPKFRRFWSSLNILFASFADFDGPSTLFLFFLGWWFRVDPPLWRGRRLRVQSRRRPTRTGSSPQPGIRGASPTLIWNCVRTANSFLTHHQPDVCLFLFFKL